MVDVYRRLPLTPSLTAGLRRLSTRASTPATPSSRNSLFSFSSLSTSIITHLKSSNISIQPGLSDYELFVIESHFNFTFPPDLRAVLSLGLPSAPGFPNWRSLPDLQASFHLPFNYCSKDKLKKAPLLIPIYNNCYIPCMPCLAGNPVFYVDETRVFCCGFDLQDFFKSEFNLGTSKELSGKAVKTPRYIEFWTHAALSDRRRRKSSSSSSSLSERSSSSSSSSTKAAEWVGSYLECIGTVLREGGWGESEVNDMVQVSNDGLFDDVMDDQKVIDGLLLKVDKCSDLLRRGGWRNEEVGELMRVMEVKKVADLPPEIALKAVARC